jgi:hypothetical protein
MSGYADNIKFEDLKGETITAIEKTDEEVTMALADGRVVTLYHSQNCCESVWLEDVVGDLGDLIGTPVLLAEESINDRPDDLPPEEWEPESQTWTFYRMTTIKGTVVLRWCGMSNGYYSEEVDIRVTPAREAVS